MTETDRNATVEYVTNQAYQCLDPTSFTPGDDLASACEEAVDVALTFAARAGYPALSDRDHHGISTGLAIWLAGAMGEIDPDAERERDDRSSYYDYLNGR